MRNTQLAIIYPAPVFDHDDACRVAVIAQRSWCSGRIVIDMSQVHDATTSALARLVLLRRALRKSGRDLLLIGLHGRAATVHQINRLSAILPAEEGLPATSPAL